MSLPKVHAGGHIRTALANDWRTPPHVLDRARVFFGGRIPFDPATGPENPTDAVRYCAGAPGTLFAPKPEEDLTAHEVLARSNGLEVAWDWPTWVNPPYGRELAAWLRKIGGEAKRGTLIVALLPCSRWETHLQKALARASCACFVRGRLAFISALDGKAVSGNPTASMLVGFGLVPGSLAEVSFATAFGPLGLCLALREVRS